MELFPDRAVQEIVDGLEAAKRLLDAGAHPAYSFTPRGGVREYVDGELAVIDRAVRRVEYLRGARYLMPAIAPTEAPTPTKESSNV